MEEDGGCGVFDMMSHCGFRRVWSIHTYLRLGNDFSSTLARLVQH